mgnify:CR=1 FL=1
MPVAASSQEITILSFGSDHSHLYLPSQTTHKPTAGLENMPVGSFLAQAELDWEGCFLPAHPHPPPTPQVCDTEAQRRAPHRNEAKPNKRYVWRYCTCVEFKADCLEEADVVAQHLLIREVKVKVHDVVDVVVAEQEEDARLTAHILDDDAQRLKDLQTCGSQRL